MSLHSFKFNVLHQIRHGCIHVLIQIYILNPSQPMNHLKGKGFFNSTFVSRQFRDTCKNVVKAIVDC